MPVDSETQPVHKQSNDVFENLKTDQIQCSEAARNDLDSIVRIHTDSLPNDVLSSLGHRFLYDFYSKTLDHAHYDLEVARSNGELKGFCLLSERTGAIMELVPARAYLHVIRLLIVKPRMFFSAVKQFLHMSRVRQLQSAEIAFIAVGKSSQQKGIGSLLIDHAADVYRAKGYRSLNTKTANQQLASHYRKRYAAREIASFAIFDQRYSVLEWNI